MNNLDDVSTIIRQMAKREFDCQDWVFNTYLYDDGTYSFKIIGWKKNESENIVESLEYWWDDSCPEYVRFVTDEEPPYLSEKDRTQISEPTTSKDQILESKELESIEPTPDRIERNKDYPLGQDTKR